jgi:Protoporphyrinogen oxidase
MALSAGTRVIVLGAGIAGLAAADQLSRAGCEVKVIEKRSVCGGTHRAHHIHPYTFDVGAIFYEDDARIFDLAPEAKSLCPTILRRQRRVAPDGSVQHYPLEPREFLRQPPTVLAKSVVNLLWSRAAVKRDGTLQAITTKRLGSSFFKSTGLSAYISRFHHVPPEEIDESFFFYRMKHIERVTRMDVLARLALRSFLSSAPVGEKVRRPLHVRPREGFGPIFDPVVQRLKRAGVEFSFDDELLSLQRYGPYFLAQSSSGTTKADAVVSTIPLDTLHRAVFGEASTLVSLDMTTLFISASGLDPRVGNVLFNFHPYGRWKRATIYSRIYPDPAISREYLAVEATIPPSGEHDPEGTFNDFRTHIAALGLGENLILEGHERVESCYPLYSPGVAATVPQIIRRLTDTGLILAGRQGRFEYLPTSSGVIRRVVEELNAAETPTSPAAAAA